MSERPTHPSRRDGAWSACLLAALCVPIVVVPLGYAGVRIVQGLLSTGVHEVHAEDARLAGLEPMLLCKTLASAALIGVLATLLAWPGAWLLRRRGGGVMTLLLVPLLFPSGLAYSGWGLLRAPGTWLGDGIERAAQAGWTELPLVVGRVLAFGGLSLWSFPLALLVLAPAVRRIDASVLEAIALEPGSGWARRWLVWRLYLPSLAVAVLLVALVMIGSPVPLHLAQVDTYATRVWLALDRMPEAQQWAAWLAAWPVVAITAAGGWCAAGVVADADTGSMPGASVRERSRWGVDSVVAVGVWLLATVVPLALFALSVRNRDSYAGFVRVNADAMARSLGVAAGVALILLLVAIAVWAAASGGAISRRAASLGVRLLAVAGLCPGVLVGSWVAGAWAWLVPPVADSVLCVMLSHATRFAFVAGLIGLRLAAQESAEERDARHVDGGVGPRGWLRSLGADAALPLLGVAVVGAVLSINEIEASIMVAPPGFDTLARRLLDYLHFSRMEELSVASVMLGGLGLAAGGLAVWLTRRAE